MTNAEYARLLALALDWEAATLKVPAVSDYDQGQLDSAVIIARQLRALLPPVGQPAVNLAEWAIRTAAIITEVADGHRYEQRIEAILLDAVKALAPVGQEAPPGWQDDGTTTSCAHCGSPPFEHHCPAPLPSQASAGEAHD